MPIYLVFLIINYPDLFIIITIASVIVIFRVIIITVIVIIAVIVVIILTVMLVTINYHCHSHYTHYISHLPLSNMCQASHIPTIVIYN